MEPDDLAVLDFALIWEPFGGPGTEDIFVTFGMTDQQFRVHVRGILTAPGTRADRPLRTHARAALRSYLV
ncbi:hypothetical protein IU433_03110 [Nocardia puris]|uniref:Uncharacterized protein n=1 Tax=Nocardia puris TaxID=208602 RepID=A0A366DY42_9NOCA|nr:hypothetical protein [Nocardia puris]MBF6210058.1 hypothetical protein [Nocardia puris]MBF6368249.1 hypothetical protein [Nocardia puris]MBF6458032.1 hypothetical protein [Nocardia puris]RBO94194.1 hypothetical protein DFR74_102617 [Nocardia puris]